MQRGKCQGSSIEAIIFPTTLSDQAYVPRMGHNHFVSQVTQRPAHPRRMHPCLQSDPAARHSRQRPLSWLSVWSPVSDLCRLSGWGEPGQRRSGDAAVSFISCASKRVDNLGAYRIPSETGFLIPSDRSRGYCLEMYSMTRFFMFLSAQQRRASIGSLNEKAS